MALIAVVLMISLSGGRGGTLVWRVLAALVASGVILKMAATSPTALVLTLVVVSVTLVGILMSLRHTPKENLWDVTMLRYTAPRHWFAGVLVWWCLLAAILIGIYVKFW